jgi:ectoine hydroxylase-related dioxygenase (phytanoyl-CoA dioxygenase family)
MERVYVQLKPGDALFFHSNLLHRSEANRSESARWSLISCYNRASNVAYNEKHTSCITPLVTVADDALLKAGASGIGAEADFLTKDADVSLTN